MPCLYEIRYLPEGRVEAFAGAPGGYYVLSDGSRVDAWTTPVWCRPCGGIEQAEQLDSIEEIDRQIAETQGQTGTGGSPFERRKRAERLLARRHWREQRTAPPKCIRCGSTDIFVFPVNQVVPHPAGAGTVEIHSIGFCDTSERPPYFSAEGDRLPGETAPPDQEALAPEVTPEQPRGFISRIAHAWHRMPGLVRRTNRALRIADCCPDCGCDLRATPERCPQCGRKS